MSLRLTKPWIPIGHALHRLHGHLGIFQLANAEGETIYIGYAGAKGKFGLKAAVTDAAQEMTAATQVRVEITTAYHTRFRELLMLHVADHGQLPAGNPPIRLGKLSPV